jgi:hypothetical protein
MPNATVFGDQVAVKGQVRAAGSTSNLTEDQLDFLVTNNRRDLLIAQSLPARAELVRMGNSWSTRWLTDVAAVLTLPTTAAQHVMHNGEAAGGKAYIIESIAYDVAVAPTDVDGGFGLLFQLSHGAVATVAAAQAVLVNSLSGKGAYGGLAAFDDANTIVDSGWAALPLRAGQGFGVQYTAHTFFYSDFEPGLIIIPPGGTLALCAFAIDTTLTGRPSVIWHEVQMPVNQ